MTYYGITISHRKYIYFIKIFIHIYKKKDINLFFKYK